jgi:hypothetical protein
MKFGLWEKMDHRLAIVLLGGLVVGAGAPLALCWARLLPDDAAPFDGPEKVGRSAEDSIEAGERRKKQGDRIAIALLVFVTISYALQFPGVPRDEILHGLASRFDATSADLITMGARAFFAFVPGLAACYSLLRTNFARIPLVTAGILVLLLWLFGPQLHAALLTS